MYGLEFVGSMLQEGALTSFVFYACRGFAVHAQY